MSDGTALSASEIGFTCSGSSDYIAGQAFAFVGAVDALGAWPQHQMVRIPKDDIGAGILDLFWIECLDRAGRADRHERGCLHGCPGSAELTGACGASLSSHTS